MKKHNALFGAILLLSPTLGLAESSPVLVQEAPLRKEATFFGAIIAKVGYPNLVDVIGNDKTGAWRQVSFKQQEGWMHISALINPVLKLTIGKDQKDSTTTGREISLAGKGFFDDVSDKVAQKKKLDFKWLDYMEKKIVIKPAELEKFAAEGDFSTTPR